MASFVSGIAWIRLTELHGVLVGAFEGCLAIVTHARINARRYSVDFALSLARDTLCGYWEAPDVHVDGAALMIVEYARANAAMNHIAGAEDNLGDLASLWVTVECLRQSQCFELDGHSRHCVVIGSSLDADLRVQGRQSTPIQCNLRREGDDVWLIPGWPTNRILIDDMLIERPVKLWRRCCMEIEGVAMEVRIREEPPTSPDIELLDPQPANASNRVSVREIIAIEGARERWPCAHDSIAQGQRLDAYPQWLGTTSEPDNSSVRRRNHCNADAFDGPPSSTAPMAVSMRELAQEVPHPLARLGLLTRRRPWMVTFGALVGSVVMATTLHLGTLLVEDARFALVRTHTDQAQPLSSLPQPCATRGVGTGSPDGASGCGERARLRLERIVTGVARSASTGVITLDVMVSASGATGVGATPIASIGATVPAATPSK